MTVKELMGYLEKAEGNQEVGLQVFLEVGKNSTSVIAELRSVELHLTYCAVVLVGVVHKR